MKDGEVEKKERLEAVLDAAEVLISRYGYDKTTMSDIAAEAGLSRAAVYRLFADKDAVLEALLRRETSRYIHTWLEQIEGDPQGGTIAGVFRAVFFAVNQSPLLKALLNRDRRVYGHYLRKPGNLYQPVQSFSLWIALLSSLQEAGAIRKDISAQVLATILGALSSGLTGGDDPVKTDEFLPFDEIMPAIALMLDGFMSPPGLCDPLAGKPIIRQFIIASRDQIEHMETKE